MNVKVAISKIKPNPKNPRVIRDDKFAKLVKSIQDFPEMLEKRPLVCFTDIDGKYVVLGGNMRLKAANEVGLKQLPILLADDWTAEQKEQFLIKDNIGFGEWNFDELQADWDVEQLEAWGLEHDWEVGDIVELPQITTTYNVNIKCDDPIQVEQLKERLGISSNSIHIQELYKLLK